MSHTVQWIITIRHVIQSNLTITNPGYNELPDITNIDLRMYTYLLHVNEPWYSEHPDIVNLFSGPEGVRYTEVWLYVQTVRIIKQPTAAHTQVTVHNSKQCMCHHSVVQTAHHSTIFRGSSVLLTASLHVTIVILHILCYEIWFLFGKMDKIKILQGQLCFHL